MWSSSEQYFPCIELKKVLKEANRFTKELFLSGMYMGKKDDLCYNTGYKRGKA